MTFLTGLNECLLRPLLTAVLYAWVLSHWFSGQRDLLIWLACAPLLYFGWLVLHLSICLVETTLLSFIYRKPRRFEEVKLAPGQTMHQVVSARLRARLLRQPMPPEQYPGQVRDGFHLLIALWMYARYGFLQSLPLVYYFGVTPGFRYLLFRAYAPACHCHPTSQVMPWLTDPELTHVGPRVVLGQNARLVAHNATRLPDGRFVFQTAPIRLGESVSIGGDSLVELGVTVGDHAIVEPFSRVVPFTQIPAGEIWGGNPAVFRARRAGMAAAPVVTSGSAPADTLALIAQALDLPAGSITTASNTTNVNAWDSIGKMAIAAALHSRCGLQLPPEEVFALDSVATVQAALDRAQKKTSRVTAVVAPVVVQPVTGPAVEFPTDPELLPLLDPATATRHLASLPKTGGKPVTVCVAATFVAQPLADALKLWARAFGLAAEVRFADFNQVPQTLLTPGSLFHQNAAGFNVVLARPEDFPGGQAEAEQVIAALKTFAAQTTSTVVVGDLPPELFGAASAAESLRAWWHAQLTVIPGVQILPFSDIIAELGKAASRDTAMAEAASTPFTPAVYQRLGIALARAVRAAHVAAKKVIAMDADNTLWRGVVGEDGATGVTVDSPFAALQKTLSELRSRGVLLALVSKNAEADVARVFAENPQMILRSADFAGTKVNWTAKSENLRALAAELNLGLEAFLFLDDNPVERLEVAAHCPGVTVLPGDPAQFAAALGKLWAFDGAGATGEDAARAEFQQHDAQRTAARTAATDLKAYLRSLELVVEIRRATADDLPRVSQLSLKTNQFNTSLVRHALPELRALATTREVWTVSARDRFGDFGLIGGLVAGFGPGGYTVDALFVSCRALGRGVEDALLHTLAQHAQAGGAKVLRVPFVAGPRNEPAKNFLRAAGFCETGGGIYELPLAELPPLPEHLRLITESEV